MVVYAYILLMKRKTQYVKVPVVCLQNLSAVQLQLWCCIASYAPSYTVTVYTLRKRFKKDRTTVLRQLVELRDRGFLKTTVIDSSGTIKYTAIIPEQ